MTGMLLLPPSFTIKRFWPKVAYAFAEFGMNPVAIIDSNVNGDVTISWEGGAPPFVVGWGDGEPEGQEASPAHHLYHVDGDYTIIVRDIVGQTATVDITVTGSSPALRGEWHNITTHAAMDAYMADHDLVEPEGWDSMTLAQKREWLDENVTP